VSSLSPEKLARSFTSLGRAILRFPNAPWADAISHGQMQSKSWAVTELLKLHRHLGLIYLLGGWLGTLPLLMFAEPRLRFTKIRSFDIDPSCEPIADAVNIEHLITDWRFKAVTKDMYRVDYERHHYEISLEGRPPAIITESCDTIINTCCDHLPDFKKWWDMIPEGRLVLIQNNNFAHATHGGAMNTITSLAEMQAQAQMSKVLFSGQKDLAKYRRFMMIGLR
jgi:hypothetical protein